MAATGLAGTMLRGPSWLPLLVLGSVQMVHGHASFLGIVPMILGLALLLAAWMRRLPFWSAGRPPASAWAARNRVPLALSLAIAMLYALPVLLHTALHWPGELGKYLGFLGALPPQPIFAALRYGSSFLPIGGLWVLLFLLPSATAPGPVQRGDAGGLRAAGLLVLVAAMLPAFWYSWREVDDVANRYLLLWVTPFVGTALVAGLFHALKAVAVNRPWRIVLCLIGTVLALNTLRGVQPSVLVDVPRNLALQRAVAQMLARPPPPGGRTELVVDPSPSAWIPSWIETVTMLAAFRRAGRDDYCVSPEIWNIVFGERARCDPGRERIRGRLFVTTWAGIGSPSAFRLDQSGMTLPRGLRPGLRQSMLETIAEGVLLEPGWSFFQPDGVWMNRAEAKLSFPAAALPEHFQLSLGGTLLAPRDQAQTVDVFDAAGLKLGALHGASGPASVTLGVARKPDSDRVTLTLRVEHPVTPAELGIGRDRHRLGFRLSEMSVAD